MSVHTKQPVELWLLIEDTVAWLLRLHSSSSSFLVAQVSAIVKIAREGEAAKQCEGEAAKQCEGDAAKQCDEATKESTATTPTEIPETAVGDVTSESRARSPPPLLDDSADEEPLAVVPNPVNERASRLSLRRMAVVTAVVLFEELMHGKREEGDEHDGYSGDSASVCSDSSKEEGADGGDLQHEAQEPACLYSSPQPHPSRYHHAHHDPQHAQYKMMMQQQQAQQQQTHQQYYEQQQFEYSHHQQYQQQEYQQQQHPQHHFQPPPNPPPPHPPPPQYGRSMPQYGGRPPQQQFQATSDERVAPPSRGAPMMLPQPETKRARQQ